MVTTTGFRTLCMVGLFGMMAAGYTQINPQAVNAGNASKKATTAVNPADALIQLPSLPSKPAPVSRPSSFSPQGQGYLGSSGGTGTSPTRSERLYSWKDKNGVMHVTNTPPPDLTTNKEERQNPTKITVTGSKTNASEGYLDQIKKQEKAKEEAEKKSKEEKMKKLEDSQLKLQCEQMASRMALYSSDNEIRKMGADGQESVVSDTSRSETLRTLREAYDGSCK